MKFLVDECAGTSIARWLSDKGYDVESITDLMPSVDDEFIIQKAFTENRIIITADKDFGDLVFYKKFQHVGIVLLRMSDQRPAKRIAAIENLFYYYSADLQDNFIVITDSAVRIVHRAGVDIAQS